MTTHRQWARLLSGVNESRSGDAALMRSAVALGLDVAPDAVGCSITEAPGHSLSTPYASDELAMALDQAQYTAGTGPCVVAARHGQPERIDDISADARFLGFAEIAAQHCVRSSLSLPLTGSDRPTGINFYAGTVGAFDNDRSRAIAQLLVRCLSALLTNQPNLTAPSVAEDAARADGQLVAEAIDRLTHDGGMSRGAAFGTLTHSAAAQRVHVAETARRVISGDEVIA